MSATAWRIEWDWAGERGTIDELSVRWLESASLVSGRRSARNVTISCLLPVDVTDLVPLHSPLSGRARLYANDRLVMAGAWRDFRYGQPDGKRTPVQFRLSRGNDEDLGRLPPPNDVSFDRDPNDDVTTLQDRLEFAGALNKDPDEFQSYLESRPPNSATGTVGETVWYAPLVLRRDRFPNLAEIAEGETWPWVYGAPGTEDAPGSPAYVYDETSSGGTQFKLMIAAHPVKATQVDIWGPSSSLTVTDGSRVLVRETSGGPVDVKIDTTTGPRPFSYVEVPTAVSGTWSQVFSDPNERYYVSWTQGEALPGGAGDLLRYVAGLSTVEYDTEAIEAAADELNRFKMAGYINRQITPDRFITDAILPLLPVEMVPDTQGLRPVFHPWWLNPDARGIAVEDGAGIARATDMVSYLTPADSAGVQLQYGQRPDTSRFTGTTTRGVGSDAYAAMSTAVGYQSYDTSSVWDPSTAERVAEMLARRRVQSPRVIPYMVTNHAEFGIGGERELYVGRMLRLTDSRLNLSGVKAYVAEREIGPDSIRISIHLLDDPLTAV